MKKFAFVDSNGVPHYTASPAVDSMYTDGAAYGDTVCREIPLHQDDSAVLNGWYWKGGWKTNRPPRPGASYTWNNDTESWVDTRTAEDAWAEVRQERTHRLGTCDWTVLPDVPLPTEARQQWEIYRQALRDVTEQADPFNIVWPVPPT